MMTEVRLLELAAVRDGFDAAGRCKACKGRGVVRPEGCRYDESCDPCGGNGWLVFWDDTAALLDLALFQHRLVCDLADEGRAAGRLAAFRKALEEIAFCGEKAVDPRRLARAVLAEHADEAEAARIETAEDAEAWQAFLKATEVLSWLFDELQIGSFAVLEKFSDAALRKADLTDYGFELLYKTLAEFGRPRDATPAPPAGSPFPEVERLYSQWSAASPAARELFLKLVR